MERFSNVDAGLVTPVDKITGLPLPILPEEPGRGAPYIRNYHHHFHPYVSSELSRDTFGGKALRFSRGQIVARSLHKNYHNTYDGPPLPETDRDRFIMCVLACSGVVPRQAIDVRSRGNPKIVNLSNKQHRSISSFNQIYFQDAHRQGKTSKRNIIGKFFADYALAQDLEDRIQPLDIEQFLDKNVSEANRARIGNLMIASALGKSLEEVKQMIPDLDREGYIASSKEFNPLRVVVSFFSSERFSEYYVALQAKFDADNVRLG